MLLTVFCCSDDNFLLQISCQSSAALVKNYFVPIFSVCMALHCSKKSGSENGAAVLQSSILSIAKISENERDILIKKHMVWPSNSLNSCIFYFLIE